MRNVKWTSIAVVIAMCLLQGMLGISMAEETAVPFRWENWEETDRTFLEEQRTTLEKAGAKVGKVEDTEPNVKSPTAVALILVGTAAVAVLTETIINAVKVSNQCGVVVDGSGKTVAIRQNCDLGPGEILAVGGVQVGAVAADSSTGGAQATLIPAGDSTPVNFAS